MLHIISISIANGHHKGGGGMEKKQSLSSNNLLTLSPTGSDLSRKESFQRMVVIQEYVSKDRTGVTVHRGQTVELIGGDREWLYVKTDRGDEGYIPRSHCVYPYAAARPEREGEMDSRPQLDRPRSFSNNQNDTADMCKLRVTPPNGIAKTRVLSPALPSPQLQRNTNNTNNEVTGVPVTEPSHSLNTSSVLKRFSDHSSSSGNYEPSDYSSGDERTMSPDQSIGPTHDNGFVPNGLSHKIASESDLLSIRDLKDRPLPATPSKVKNQPHVYSLIDDFPSKDTTEVADNECPYSNPLDAIPANQSSWMDNKRWHHHGSASDLLRHHSRQREATPEWKPPLPSRAPLQQGSTDMHRLSTGSTTGSQRSISGSTDGSYCTEHKNNDNKAHKFRKFIWGVYVMQQDFDAVDENEISVRTGQHVSLLNQDDVDWYWVVRHDDSQEGFVPRAFLVELMHVEQPYSAGKRGHRCLLCNYKVLSCHKLAQVNSVLITVDHICLILWE